MYSIKNDDKSLSEMNPPARLYKYEAFSAQTLENLKAQRIYFGSPSRFNDPYDCATNPIVLLPSPKEAELIREYYFANESTSEEVKLKFKQMSVDSLREMFQRVGSEAISSAVDRFPRERGVSCFSEHNNNLLMWGHYGGKYKGFCLEFSTDYLPFAKAKPVIYVNQVPHTSVTSFLTGSEMDAVTELFYIKSASWSYEKEWRIVHKNVGTLYQYEAKALIAVYFGPEVSEEALEIIALILRGQNSSVKLFRGERSKSDFNVIFNEFGYLTHLEAKDLGLR